MGGQHSKEQQQTSPRRQKKLLTSDQSKKFLATVAQTEADIKAKKEANDKLLIEQQYMVREKTLSFLFLLC
jgi:hypothetical protein